MALPVPVPSFTFLSQSASPTCNASGLVGVSRWGRIRLHRTKMSDKEGSNIIYPSETLLEGVCREACRRLSKIYDELPQLGYTNGDSTR